MPFTGIETNYRTVPFTWKEKKREKKKAERVELRNEIFALEPVVIPSQRI